MNATLLIELLILAIQKAETLAALYQKTKAEGREPTDDELNLAASGDDASRAALQAWIDAKKAGG